MTPRTDLPICKALAVEGHECTHVALPTTTLRRGSEMIAVFYEATVCFDRIAAATGRCVGPLFGEAT